MHWYNGIQINDFLNELLVQACTDTYCISDKSHRYYIEWKKQKYIHNVIQFIWNLRTGTTDKKRSSDNGYLGLKNIEERGN